MNPETLSILHFGLQVFCLLMLAGIVACFFAD
jgi:hypothetical protein